jgi:hypothetical protein
MGFGDLPAPSPGHLSHEGGRPSPKLAAQRTSTAQALLPSPVPSAQGAPPARLMSLEDFACARKAALEALQFQQTSMASGQSHSAATTPMAQLPRFTRRFPDVIGGALASDQVDTAAAGGLCASLLDMWLGSGLTVLSYRMEFRLSTVCPRCPL